MPHPPIATAPSPHYEALFSRRACTLTDSAIRAIGKELTRRKGVISFAGGVPAPETFPVGRIEKACEKVLSKHATSALQYGPTAGYGPLREWIANSLSKDGASVHPDQVQITTGSQQALDLLGKVLLDTGDRVGVETPTYVGALQALGVYAPEFVSLKSDREGVLADGVSAAGPLKLAYLIPCFQNPTGRTLTLPRRHAIVQQAQQHQVLLLEDDPYGGLDYQGTRHTTLYSLNPAGIVHLGSFSKVLAPGLRLGYAVGPLPLIRKLEQAKQATDLHTSAFVQLVTYEVLQDDFLTQHLVSTRAFYAGRCHAMMQSLQTHLAGQARWTQPEGGMFTWLELEAEYDASQLLPHALDQGVAFVPGAPFYAQNPSLNTLRLSFAGVTPEQIEQGVLALARTLKAAGPLRKATE